jgi:hypothetical protein
MMLISVGGIALAIVLLWVAAQFFGGRFSRFPHNGLAGGVAMVAALLLMLAMYVYG